jgi:hypothetical protein
MSLYLLMRLKIKNDAIRPSLYGFLILIVLIYVLSELRSIRNVRLLEFKAVAKGDHSGYTLPIELINRIEYHVVCASCLAFDLGQFYNMPLFHDYEGILKIQNAICSLISLRLDYRLISFLNEMPPETQTHHQRCGCGSVVC